MRKSHTVREVITYPKVTVTSTYDPCHDKSSPYEHILACKHLITTPEPDEPCASNCYFATQTRSRQAPKMTLSAALNKDFYCDACVELEVEKAILATVTNEEAGEQNASNTGIEANGIVAEDQRAAYREMTAAKRNKVHDFRKCYIAQKNISIPCDDKGQAVEGYRPHPGYNAYDMSWPPTGANMYEDVDIIRPQKSKKKKKKRPLAAVLMGPGTPAIIDGEAVAEDVNETVAEGARWLQEEEERERRRVEGDTPATRRRRAAARPIVISSSPDTDLSSFVVDDSGLHPAQTNAQVDSSRPMVAKKKLERKRKKAVNEEAEVTTTPAHKPKKRVKAAPKAPGPDPGISASNFDARSRFTMQKEKIYDAAAKAVLERHRERAAEEAAAVKPTMKPAKRAKLTPKASYLVDGHKIPSAMTGQKSQDSREGDTTRSKSKVVKRPSKGMCSVL